MLLQLDNVKKAFIEPDGHVLPILDIHQYQLERGEQVVLVGPSGCGKTTLLHVIAGISRADGGTIRLDGTDVGHLSEAGRDRFRAAKIGYIFQTFNLLPGFSAMENVLLGMTFSHGGMMFSRGRKDTDRAKDLLHRVGLSQRASHKPAALSVGEQQRVAVARALAGRPALILADEPTANVDQTNQEQIVELIRKTCREEGVGLLMVTHSGDVASQFDRVDQLEEINLVRAADQSVGAANGEGKAS